MQKLSSGALWSECVDTMQPQNRGAVATGLLGHRSIGKKTRFCRVDGRVTDPVATAPRVRYLVAVLL
jgi:hypothetical protein